MKVTKTITTGRKIEGQRIEMPWENEHPEPSQIKVISQKFHTSIPFLILS